MQAIVLASASPWRRQLLSALGVVTVVDPADLDERAVTAPDPSTLARLLAQAKAQAVAARHPDAWVLGADQVAVQGHEVFGKPADAEAHLARLRGMRGRTHDLISAWHLVGPGPSAGGLCTTRMHVRADLTDAEIRAYVASGEGRGCAGGYAAEGRGGFLFERVEGDWFNVIGLPVLDVMTALRARGWRHGGPA